MFYYNVLREDGTESLGSTFQGFVNLKTMRGLRNRLARRYEFQGKRANIYHTLGDNVFNDSAYTFLCSIIIH